MKTVAIALSTLFATVGGVCFYYSHCAERLGCKPAVTPTAPVALDTCEAHGAPSLDIAAAKTDCTKDKADCAPVSGGPAMPVAAKPVVAKEICDTKDCPLEDCLPTTAKKAEEICDTEDCPPEDCLPTTKKAKAVPVVAKATGDACCPEKPAASN